MRRVDLAAGGARVVHLVTAEECAAACPSCGVFSTSVKQNVTTSPKDLPYGETRLDLVSRWRCREEHCPRQTFTEQIDEVPAGMRTTGRLRRAAADAVANARCVAELAGALRVSWPTVQRAVDVRARAVLGEPSPTPVVGIDETRFGRPRWIRQVLPETGQVGWRRSDPWETGFVDLAGGQGLLGQVSGRTSRCVIDWLEARGDAFKAAVQVWGALNIPDSGPNKVHHGMEGTSAGASKEVFVRVSRGSGQGSDRDVPSDRSGCP